MISSGQKEKNKCNLVLSKYQTPYRTFYPLQHLFKFPSDMMWRCSVKNFLVRVGLLVCLSSAKIKQLLFSLNIISMCTYSRKCIKKTYSIDFVSKVIYVPGETFNCSPNAVSERVINKQTNNQTYIFIYCYLNANKPIETHIHTQKH